MSKTRKQKHKLKPLQERRLERANLLLRRVYDIIEMSHLTDIKLLPHYCEQFTCPRKLGEDIFNHLCSDQEFLNVVVKRQARYRRHMKVIKKKAVRNEKLQFIRK